MNQGTALNCSYQMVTCLFFLVILSDATYLHFQTSPYQDYCDLLRMLATLPWVPIPFLSVTQC